MAFPAKATHQQTRAHNSALVLRALYDFGPISRADVARLSGLTRTTVGELVGELIGDGLAREMGRGPSTGGKAPILVELVDDARHVIAPRPRRAGVPRGASSTCAGRSSGVIERPVEGLDGDAPWTSVYELIDELARARPARDAPRHRRRDAGHRRRGDRHDPLGRQPRLAGPAARRPSCASATASRPSSPTTAARPRRSRSSCSTRAGRASNLVAIKVGPGHRRRRRPRRRAVPRRRLRRRRDRPHGRRGRRRRVPLRPVRLPRDRRQLARDRAACHRSREPSVLTRCSGGASRPSGELTLDDVRAAVEAGDEARPPDRGRRRSIPRPGDRRADRRPRHRADRPPRQRRRSRRAVAVAVRDEASRRSLGLLARDTTIDVAPPIGDFVVMGASALLITAELGLTVGR